ncbi:MAG: hypothetical protein O2897_01520 [bacterium]|nr:hypothetical protein [bacterium]
MSTEVKKFHFSDLPKLTRLQVQVNNLFYSKLVDFDKVNDWEKIFSTTCSDTLQTAATITLDNMESFKARDYFNRISAHDCLCVSSLPPQSGLFFIDTPADLTKDLIYRVLGKDNETPNDDQALSEVEKGIFTYIVIKIIATLKSEKNLLGNNQVQILQTLQYDDALKHHVDEESILTILNFKLRLEQQTFFFRIILTAELITNLAKLTPTANHNLQLAKIRAAAVKERIIVEVGQVALKAKDYKTLDIDDIIVLEESDLHLKQLGLKGEVFCKIGESEFGSFTGNLLITPNGRYAVQVKDLIAAKGMN